MQRLFSMFPTGWPGAALLLLRVVAGTLAIEHGLFNEQSTLGHVLGASVGALLVAGLWTPAASVALAASQSWAALTLPDDPSSRILLAATGAALAMLGPGATSIDNRLFGRRRVKMPRS